MSRTVLAPLIVLATACATPYAKLDGMLVGARPVATGDSAVVVISGDGAPRPGKVQQSLGPGDTLRTLADGTAVLTLRPGYELIVEPGSVINIENPSILVRVGRLLLRKLKETREALRLNTEFVSAGVEGTEFVFEVARDGVVRLTVLQGTVWLRPHTAAWATAYYQAGESVVIREGSPPDPIQPVDAEAIQAFRDRSFAIERAVGYGAGEPWSRFTPLWRKPAFLISTAAVAAGITTFVLTRGGGTRSGTVTVQIPF